MRGQVDDLICLTLLVIFFGVYQRHRHQLYFRFWCVGWGLVFLGLLAWEWPMHERRLVLLQDVVVFELLLAGLVAFLLSLQVTQTSWRRTLRWGLYIFVPMSAGMVAETIAPFRSGVLSALVVVGQTVAIAAASRLVPKEWTWSRRVICGLAVVCGVAMLVVAQHDGKQEIVNLVLAEILLSTAVGYLSLYGSASVGWMGAVGFALWGLFYLAQMYFPVDKAGWGNPLKFWNLPKELVGFAMILHVFDVSRREMGGLADEYRLLYQDFRLLYEGHPYPMWIYESEGGRIVSVNEAAVRVYGYDEAEFFDLRVDELEVPLSAAEAAELMLVPESTEGKRARHRYKDDRMAWVNVLESAIVFQGQAAKLMIARDITDKLRINRELAHRAHHDALTGLPNRMLLRDRIEQSLSRCDREDRSAVLFMIDVDHFKWVNDTYGHAAGDECLRQVGARLAAKIRQIDTIARVGGEEFAAIIGGLSSQRDAEKIGAMLLAQFATPLRIGKLELRLTVSVGAAMYPADSRAIAELLDQADRALYQAKEMGRNQVVFWEEALPRIEQAGEVSSGV
jgi:diguanylate cyclase (GGDEF)-like protein/PAS domain S-box-containing protein